MVRCFCNPLTLPETSTREINRKHLLATICENIHMYLQSDILVTKNCIVAVGLGVNSAATASQFQSIWQEQADVGCVHISAAEQSLLLPPLQLFIIIIITQIREQLSTVAQKSPS